MWPILMLSLALHVIAPATHQAQTAQADRHMLTLINDTRDSYGLPPLTNSPALAAAALEHARKMAAAGRIFHTPSLHAVAPRWMALGENVGVADSIDEIFADFLQSAEHKANILDRSFTSAGVAVVPDATGSTFYLAVLFGG
jgi:uncharacterized protein YkwD